MKKIYLMRHAKALKDKDREDFDRDLNSRGKQDLKKLFSLLSAYTIKPDYILASPAKRTAKTAEKFAKLYNFKKQDIVFNHTLYTANAEEIFSLIQKIQAQYNEILIIGHNPHIIHLCELLGSLCLTCFPTSSILCLEFDINDFQDLQEHSGKLVFFEHIRDLKDNEAYFQPSI
ncbi:histidine phosphatase family protein [Campylobacter sp. MIT 21-1685]|uniref:SixA phosphatase family protein n=1 Tax=unclassified Campylobacter TaxID=2593542 RepID=UPI00224A9123|nr:MULTISPECIES: histidine phosphatase family protein [unclassified Campylobacter]MCX2682942.1 histidine phosphatase family protein [Campylobacter sp. MIT 21-1684]MCX2751224.1 histidine phosphatase family protein [Campylobacter sp. MIT 21-1682]MCX2807423.1 histidine phosphatase family protein [Campylobacter sp. MIT 21-1685]